ncbi:hypothetical protein [Vibrio harveyi]|uniref:hypothetical protein n=1 Tax=Vibrio harveyi TaxID=669 RepID=UPI00069E135B|nr:hypothetical protein [Vibrio harveyi]KNY41663.1 hypothetical protein AKG93_17235 [Vibrio harveyi]
MESIKHLISRHEQWFPEFNYYFTVIEEIERFRMTKPDISIDGCAALIEGICKTIILGLDDEQDREKLNKMAKNKLAHRAVSLLKDNDDIYENTFANRAAEFIGTMGTLRNARGDISHGKASPKELPEDSDLTRLIIEFTDSLTRYLLSSYFNKELDSRRSMLEDVEYDENPNFNAYLDDEFSYESSKVSYSQALYDQYYEDYLVQLAEYKAQEEPEEIE